MSTNRATITSHHAHMRRPSSSPSSQPISMALPNPEPRTAPGVGETNVPDRHELFILGDNEKKVTETIDTRIPSTSIFIFNKEDHTLGNMVTSQLRHMPQVTFAGYKVPHPLVEKFELRLGTDGTITPRAALVEACRTLVKTLGTIGNEFSREYALRKMVSEGLNGSAQDGGN